MTCFAFQAVVAPGSIWDRQKHGLWTRIHLSEQAMTDLELNYNMLLHDAIVTGSEVPDPVLPVIEFLLQEDIELIGLRCASSVCSMLQY